MDMSYCCCNELLLLCCCVWMFSKLIEYDYCCDRVLVIAGFCHGCCCCWFLGCLWLLRFVSLRCVLRRLPIVVCWNSPAQNNISQMRCVALNWPFTHLSRLGDTTFRRLILPNWTGSPLPVFKYVCYYCYCRGDSFRVLLLTKRTLFDSLLGSLFCLFHFITFIYTHTYKCLRDI